MKQKLKIGDFVVLSQKAVKDFYGREDRIDDFAVGGDLNNLRPDQFLDFVNTWLGFENGIGVGVIAGIGDNSVEVIFATPTETLDFGYYEHESLKKVKVRIV